MAHDHRTERPTRRGRVDDSGGDTEGGKKLYYHLTLLAENDAGLPQPDPARRAWRSSRATTTSRGSTGSCSRSTTDGLIATTGCLGGHVLQSLLQGDEKGALEKAGRLQEIFGRDNLFVELQDHGLPAQRETNPKLIEIAKQDRRAAARHQRLALHPPRGPRGPRRAAVRADRRAALATRSGSSSRARSTTSRPPHEMRYLFRELPEACDNTLWIAERADVDDRVRQAAAARTSRCPRASPTTPSYLDHLTWEGAKRALGRRPAARRRRAARRTSCRSSTNMGFASLLPDRLGPHQARPGRRHPRRPGPWLGGRVRGGVLPADHRPRPDQVRPAVRALPQPEPHLDARHRHGLRLALPRRDDPLRRRAVRPRPRRPDHHVRHDQGPQRGARRGPGARLSRTASATRSPRRCRRS